MLSPRFVGGAAENLQIRRIILRGDKKMKKMNKPEVEAVRFRGGIDVIATSGHYGSALKSDGTYYVTRIKEFYQAGRTGTGSENAFYDFYFASYGGGYTGAHEGHSTSESSEYAYAWFNASNNTWGTDNKKISEYDSVDNLPTGVDY